MNRTRWRTVGSIIGGILAGLLLFLFTGSLIDGDPGRHGAAAAGQIVGLIRIQEEKKVITKVRPRHVKPKPVENPPPAPKIDRTEEVELPTDRVRIAIPEIGLSAVSGRVPRPGLTRGPGQASGPAWEGDAVPIFRIDPDYPREALIDGIEGYVRLKVLIGTDGSVLDVEVTEAEPGRTFVRNAIRAVRRWKFKPRIVNGVPEEQWATTSVVFELDD